MDVITPHSELLDNLLQLGWSLKKTDLRGGQYVAKATNDTTGQEIERTGRTPELAVAALYQFAQRANSIRAYAARKKVAAWGTSDWLNQVDEIGQAYSEMPTYDEKAAPAWQALAAESKTQADAIRQQIKVEVVDEPEPYKNAQEMCEDVHKNKNFKVSRANSDHPIWSVEDNVNFRIVHDVLGHCQSGGDFGWQGENLACGAHFPLISPLAREALFTECIGQTAYYQVHRGFGPQKVGFLTQYLQPVQQKEGEHVWVPHGGLPQLAQGQGDMANVQTGAGEWIPPENFQPSPTFSLGNPVMQGYDVPGPGVKYAPPKQSKSVSDNLPHDPNQFWNPSTQAPPINPSEDPESDYIDISGTLDNAAKLNTEWQNEDEDTQNKAIMNAFRVALLSPRKHIKWNAAHYQALMHHDPTTPAVDLWSTLENAREQHNQSLGYPEGSHLAYRKQLEYLAHKLQEQNPMLTSAEAFKEAKQIVFNKTKEYEAALYEEHGDEQSELRRYNNAHRLTAEWIKEHYSPARGWQPGQMELAAKIADDQSTLFEQDPNWQPIQDDTGFANEEAKYGAFMGGHLDAIANIGQHIDELRQAAHQDLKEGGKGHIFRNKVMNMNLPGVNPKVASFAWLLLAPLSSELGIIDTHIMRGLQQPDESPKVRDYYKMERMQRAAKDASGYSHVPLGLYHWGLWDQIRNPGQHSDHSALRVLDPLPWDSPDTKWDAAFSARQGPWVGPRHFEEYGRPAALLAANEFDQEFTDQPSGQIPRVRSPHEETHTPSAYTLPAI